MRGFFESVGGRKMVLIAASLLLAALNEGLGWGISQDTIETVIYGAVGGSGTIALEDALRALFKKEKPDA